MKGGSDREGTGLIREWRKGDRSLFRKRDYRGLSVEDKRYIVTRQAGVCALCPETFLSPSFQDARFDHTKPLSLGGEHTWQNVQALCLKCHDDKTRSERKGEVGA